MELREHPRWIPFAACTFPVNIVSASALKKKNHLLKLSWVGGYKPLEEKINSFFFQTITGSWLLWGQNGKEIPFPSAYRDVWPTGPTGRDAREWKELPEAHSWLFRKRPQCTLRVEPSKLHNFWTLTHVYVYGEQPILGLDGLGNELLSEAHPTFPSECST